MFTWFLITLEVAILIGVFWYVYLRQDRPHKVKSTIWGKYQSDGSDDNVYLLLSNQFENGMKICGDQPEQSDNNVLPFKHPDQPNGKRSA
jgi:hypothetical protein